MDQLYNVSNSKNQSLYGTIIKEKQLFLQYLTYNYETYAKI